MRSLGERVHGTRLPAEVQAALMVGAYLLVPLLAVLVALAFVQHNSG